MKEFTTEDWEEVNRKTEARKKHANRPIDWDVKYTGEIEACTLDDFREDFTAALDAERGDVPDHDQMEIYRVQPIRQYARRSL